MKSTVQNEHLAIQSIKP